MMLLTIADVGGRALGGNHFPVGPLLLLLLIGLLVFLFVKRTRRNGSWMAQPSTGLAVLDERYANSEIDREEYLAKRKDLDPRSKRPDKKK